MDIDTQDNRYEAEIDMIDQAEWDDLLPLFADSMVYQTWSYGAIRWGRSNLSHIVIKKEDAVVGAAQVVIKKVPLLGVGIAYIPWGPLWKRRQGNNDQTTLREVLKIIRNEYASRRKLFLRISPNIIQSNENEYDAIMIDTDFHKNEAISSHRTFLLDLQQSDQEIRKNLDQKWRNQLNRSEKNGLKVISGDSEELYADFMMLQQQMQSRKKYLPGVSYDEFKRIQIGLPKTLKMNILVCEYNGEAISAAICSAIGETGIYLLGATGNKGLTHKGAYLLQWKIIQWLKEKKCRWYDLGGINPEKNPGVYHFKAGLGGKDITYIGQYEKCNNMTSRIIVGSIDQIRMYAKKVIQ